MKNIFLIIIIIFAGCDRKEITTGDVVAAEKIIGINFTAAERDSLLDGLKEQLSKYEELRAIDLPNNVEFPLYYNPHPAGMNLPKGRDKFDFNDVPTVVPDNLEACAFMTVPELAHLIRTRQVTSEALTRMYIDRLKRYQDQLQCVVTITEELAIQQARKADMEIAR